MSQQGNFIGGFLLGTVVGGVVGGIVGVLAASRLSQTELPESEANFSRLENKPEGKIIKRRQLKAPTEQTIEAARRGLEDKIAQLNDAIDDVRQQLGSVNGAPKERSEERAISPDP